MGLRIASKHPPGLIGIVSSTMGRYREFDASLNATHIPKTSAIWWEIGLDLARGYNNICEKFLEDGRLQWLWILGDDHTFKENTLMNMLDRNVDIVVPLCLQRVPPFKPVLYSLRDDKHWQLTCEELNYRKGLMEVDAAGNAGMLIKRRVIEQIESDWHRVGWLEPDRSSSDLYFCKRARDNGFKIHVDLDNPIGHISHMAVWPTKDMNGEYNVGIGRAMEYPEETETLPLPDTSDFFKEGKTLSNEEMAKTLNNRDTQQNQIKRMGEKMRREVSNA